MLHENGFELEEETQSERIVKIGPVVEVFSDFVSRARSLYSKTVSSNSDQNDRNSQIFWIFKKNG